MIRPRWFVPAGLLAALGGLLLFGALSSGNGSPQRFVGASYVREPARDLDGGVAKAYTSPRPPTTVAEEIAGQWRPADRHADGSGIYLRYADDVVTVLPLAAGSLILIENVRTAYPRYYGAVGGFWGWSTRGEDVRGGGPGAGK